MFKLDKEVDDCIFTIIEPRNRPLMKVIMKCVNINLCYILGCFHYILNAPRIIHVIKMVNNIKRNILIILTTH